MSVKWIIEYFESSTGNKPVEEFINSLEEKAQVKIFRTFELLEEFGIRLGLPHVKKLTGTSLWELRILGSDSIRIFYIAKEQQTFLLLHAIKKKTQKTEKKEIKIANERLNEFLNEKKKKK
ncbi:MAG TPA: type II toxin-antitoxin system RelE/ParE family toxin [Candidatus Sulfotelmatobacter sp.]|jgi:phage-related protein|nr:type II toxin-antitoxin system RelE/ParE family toxin [Candidatus Sulfotelmatobacter sp.]